MSWEANRWTARTPSELYHTLGPHAVDDLVRQMISAVWRHLPEEGRTFPAAIAEARAVFERNVAVWRKIKQPDPASFFADLRPIEADGHLRQAMVLHLDDDAPVRRAGREGGDPDCHRYNGSQPAMVGRRPATFTGGKKARAKKKPKPAAAKVERSQAHEDPSRHTQPSFGSIGPHRERQRYRSASEADGSEAQEVRRRASQHRQDVVCSAAPSRLAGLSIPRETRSGRRRQGGLYWPLARLSSGVGSRTVPL